MVHHWQLLALGYSKQAIRTLIRRGWLHRVHRVCMPAATRV